jgi:hypothetical protein
MELLAQTCQKIYNKKPLFSEGLFAYQGLRINR